MKKLLLSLLVLNSTLSFAACNLEVGNDIKHGGYLLSDMSLAKILRSKDYKVNFTYNNEINDFEAEPNMHLRIDAWDQAMLTQGMSSEDATNRGAVVEIVNNEGSVLVEKVSHKIKEGYFAGWTIYNHLRKAVNMLPKCSTLNH